MVTLRYGILTMDIGRIDMQLNRKVHSHTIAEVTKDLGITEGQMGRLIQWGRLQAERFPGGGVCAAGPERLQAPGRDPA